MTQKITHFHTPIFFKDGNLFVFISTAYIARTEADAQGIGELAAQSVGLLTGAEFTGEALEVGKRPQRYVKTRLGSFNVAVLSGPLFTRAIARDAA